MAARDNRPLAAKLLMFVVLMAAFGYALAPMYRSICNALGINVLALSDVRSASESWIGAPSARNTQVDTTRTVSVEFDANARGPWEFKPERSSLQVHPGEVVTVLYRFKNVQNRAMAAQAIPSYAPRQAAAHFVKLECFCFTEHTLAPGESKEWPVVFYVDTKLPRDVGTITLSYTFFEVAGKGPAVDKGADLMGTERGTLLQTITAVAWSFFGVRRSADLERDVQRLKPAQVVIAGVVGAAIFVAALVLLVNWVVAHAA